MDSDAKAIDGEAPTVAFGELAGPFAKKGAADRTGHFEGAVAGEVVDALVDDEDAARGMQVQRVAAQAALEAAGAHGALLKKGRGEAAFAESGEGADRVVSEDDGGAGEVEFWKDPTCAEPVSPVGKAA